MHMKCDDAVSQNAGFEDVSSPPLQTHGHHNVDTMWGQSSGYPRFKDRKTALPPPAHSDTNIHIQTAHAVALLTAKPCSHVLFPSTALMPHSLWSSLPVPTTKALLLSPEIIYICSIDEINKQRCPEWDGKMRLHIKTPASPFELSPSGFLSVPWQPLLPHQIGLCSPPSSFPYVFWKWRSVFHRRVRGQTCHAWLWKKS